MLANPFTFREVQLRGLVAIGRITEAIAVMRADEAPAAPVAPQWHILERVTAGERPVGLDRQVEAGGQTLVQDQ